jgi:hypothetical protein
MVTAKIAISGELLFRSGDVIENAPVSYFVAVVALYANDGLPVVVDGEGVCEGVLSVVRGKGDCAFALYPAFIRVLIYLVLERQDLASAIGNALRHTVIR